MGIRQTINEKPQLTTAVTAGIILLALVFIIWQATGSGTPRAASGPPKAFFSDDDGKTWFIGDATNVPPFDHNGKQAYKAVIYRCGGGKAFVAYLQKPSEQQRAQLAAAASSSTPGALTIMSLESPMDSKKPGEEKWINAATNGMAAEYQRVITPVCPDGDTTKLVPVTPLDADNGATGG